MKINTRHKTAFFQDECFFFIVDVVCHTLTEVFSAVPSILHRSANYNVWKGLSGFWVKNNISHSASETLPAKRNPDLPLQRTLHEVSDSLKQGGEAFMRGFLKNQTTLSDGLKRPFKHLHACICTQAYLEDQKLNQPCRDMVLSQTLVST